MYETDFFAFEWSPFWEKAWNATSCKHDLNIFNPSGFSELCIRKIAFSDKQTNKVKREIRRAYRRT